MTGRLNGTVLAAALALLVAGPAQAWAQQVVTLPARDRLLADQPVNVFSIGRAEGQSWEMFSGIRGMTFDASDNLYVLDGQNHRVVVFDPRGRFVRQFGKRGGGPGELQAPLHIVIDGEGHVVIADLGNRAFVLFTPAGEHVRNVPFGSELGMPAGGMLADARGGVLVRSMGMPRPGTQPDDFTTVLRQPLAAGAAPIQVARIPIVTPTISSQGASGQAQFVVRMDAIFAPRVSFGALPDGGIAYQHETEYAVKVTDASGRHVRTISRAVRPRRVTRQDQDAWRERQRNAPAPTAVMVTTGSAGTGVSVGGGAGSGARPVDMPEPEFAEVMSVISSIRTDVTGRIWIQRRNTDGSERGPIDLVDATGRYIGTLPAQQAPSAVSRSGLAAYAITDDLGIERVVVRRLPGSWR